LRSERPLVTMKNRTGILTPPRQPDKHSRAGKCGFQEGGDSDAPKTCPIDRFNRA